MKHNKNNQKLFKIIFCLYHFFISYVFSVNQIQLNTLFAFIHYDPFILPEIFNISIPISYDDYDMENNRSILKNIECLDTSSKIHAENIAVYNCPFQHNTCFCNTKNCSINDRIDTYCRFSIDQYLELLVKSNNSDILSILGALLNSDQHKKLFLKKKK